MEGQLRIQIHAQVDTSLDAGDGRASESFHEVQDEAAVGTKEMYELAREPKESSNDLNRKSY